MTIDELAVALGFPSREALYDASTLFGEEGDVTWYITPLADGRGAAWDDAEIDLGRVQFFATEAEAVAEQESGWAICHSAQEEESP